MCVSLSASIVARVDIFINGIHACAAVLITHCQTNMSDANHFYLSMRLAIVCCRDYQQCITRADLRAFSPPFSNNETHAAAAEGEQLHLLF